jgi:hypothetical protein
MSPRRHWCLRLGRNQAQESKHAFFCGKRPIERFVSCCSSYLRNETVGLSALGGCAIFPGDDDGLATARVVEKKKEND